MEDLFKLSYDKISDDLYLLGYNTILRFNVTLSKPTQEGKRYYYHQEYEYNSNKYIDTNKLRTVRRQFDFFLSIENLRSIEERNKEFIMIRIQDIVYVREQLKEVIQWIRGEEYKNLYATKGNKIIMLGSPPSLYISGLAGDKWLRFEPSIVVYNEIYSTAIRMYLSSNDNYVDMSIDKFMGMVYLIDSINMYESAQLLINYLQRPDIGTNLHSFDNRPSLTVDEPEGFVETKIKNRTIGNDRKQKSFFDKIDEL